MNIKIGYTLLGIATGFIAVFNFLMSLPDGKLHIVVCNVGQGDATYVRFPDGRDMLIDGGPNDSVLSCLGRHMPFWDRTIDIVLLTHPEKDHMNGLISVLSRFRIGYFVHSRMANATEGYKSLATLIERQKIPERFVIRGNDIFVGSVLLHVLWPSDAQLAIMNQRANVLGAGTEHVNDASIVMLLRYGAFDGLFPGDADTRVEAQYAGSALADGELELLKIPHHGSKTGMDSSYTDWLKPHIAVISVGNNSYGHPAPEILALLAHTARQVLRTDLQGDIEVISDGRTWETLVAKNDNHLTP